MAQDAPINKKQKLLVEYLIADRSVFVKCIRITKASYFEPPLDRVVECIAEYFNKHHNIPTVDIIEAETGILLKERELDNSEAGYFLDEFEKHCRDSAMTEAILSSVDHVNEGNLNIVQDLVRNALMVKIDNQLGTDLFEDPEERIRGMNQDVDERSIGIDELDRLIGKIRRGELGLFFGGTAGGKSVMLANVANNMASCGLDVFVVSLELGEALYSKRMDSIVTGTDIAEHQLLAAEIAEALKTLAPDMGRIVTKKMPYGTQVSDIRALVMEYHLKYGKYPDVLIVDYLGLMGANTGRKSSGKFEEDELKAFGLRDLSIEYNMYGFTAGQINRDGYDVVNLGPNHVAGGISVINASDWAVGLVSTEEDIDNNQVQGVQMKIRNGGKTTKPIILYRCPKTLRMSDKPFVGKLKSPIIEQKKEKSSDAGSKTPVSGKDKLRQAIRLGKK